MKTIIPKYLPAFCYSVERRQPVGRIIHYFSAINADPDRWDDPQRCWELFHDLNCTPDERKYGPWKIDLGGGHPGGIYASADYLVHRDGTIWQLAPQGAETWHAGESILNARENCNAWCSGIETIAAPNLDRDHDFTDAQYESIAWLCRGVSTTVIAGHDQVRRNYIDAHPDEPNIATKFDPGPTFDWHKLVLEMQALEEVHDLDGG